VVALDCTATGRQSAATKILEIRNEIRLSRVCGEELVLVIGVRGKWERRMRMKRKSKARNSVSTSLGAVR
jgi:hypothetical protein